MMAVQSRLECLELALSEDDRARLARLIVWIKDEYQLNNAQLARHLMCSASSIGLFLRQTKRTIHIITQEKLALLLDVPTESIRELIQTDSGWSLSHRVKVMKSKKQKTDGGRAVPCLEHQRDPLANIAQDMLDLPLEALPKVIEMAVTRLSAAAQEKANSKGGSSMSNNNFLKKRERTMISLLVWISWQERKKRGEEIKFEEDSLLATFVYSQGRDFLSVDGVFSVNECARYELDEIAQFCFKAKWEKNTPRICKMESYASWDELMDSISSVNGAFSLC